MGDEPDPQDYRNPYLVTFFKMDSADGFRIYQKLYMPLHAGQDSTTVTTPPAFCRPQEPQQNCFIESFNGKFRDDYLNEELLYDLADAGTKIEEWWIDYN